MANCPTCGGLGLWEREDEEFRCAACSRHFTPLEAVKTVLPDVDEEGEDTRATGQALKAVAAL